MHAALAIALNCHCITAPAHVIGIFRASWRDQSHSKFQPPICLVRSKKRPEMPALGQPTPYPPSCSRFAWCYGAYCTRILHPEFPSTGRTHKKNNANFADRKSETVPADTRHHRQKGAEGSSSEEHRDTRTYDICTAQCGAGRCLLC